jgi:hypothetical protein
MEPVEPRMARRFMGWRKTLFYGILAFQGLRAGFGGPRVFHVEHYAY